jgi:glutathionylspermidine synthase
LSKSAHHAKLPWTAGNPLTATEWSAYRSRLASESLRHDIPSADYYLPLDFPLVLERKEWQRLATIAEKLTSEVLAAERELFLRNDLHKRLGLPASIREVLRTAKEGGEDAKRFGAARYMRFDFHLTSEGLRISEVNADTLGGFNVASLFTELMAPYYSRYSRSPDPVLAHAKAVRQAVGAGGLVAIVRRTVHARDCEAKYMAAELRKQGLKSVIVSPGDLTWRSGRAWIARGRARGAPDLLIRFLDAEWLPKLRPGSLWKRWFRGSETVMSNPGASILIQSKRLPVLWDELKTPMPTWRAVIPETRCPGELQDARQGEWVLKPVFGRVGREVAIRGISSRRGYKEAVRQAKRHPYEWVAQRRFEMLPIETARGRRHICLGVFTVDGKAAGAYGRIAKTALIGLDAKDVVVLLQSE